MIKFLFILIAIAVFGGISYYSYHANPNPTEILQDKTTTFTVEDLGLQFDYKVGLTGYVLEERVSALAGTLVRTLTLFQTEDKIKGILEGGEGPAVIAIQVFNNPQGESPETWANENVQYSNINLKQGEISKTSIGGAPAIRYMADGLYASEIAVFTKGEYAYIITGQFIDADSDIRRDFVPFLDSIRFMEEKAAIS